MERVRGMEKKRKTDKVIYNRIKYNVLHCE